MYHGASTLTFGSYLFPLALVRGAASRVNAVSIASQMRIMRGTYLHPAQAHKSHLGYGAEKEVCLRSSSLT